LPLLADEHGNIGNRSPDVGELSVFWDEVIARWVVLYNSLNIGGAAGASVVFFYAKDPWGPWSQISNVNIADSEFYPYLVYAGPRDQPPVPSWMLNAFGYYAYNMYAPYRVQRYGTWNPWSRSRTIQYALSTMQATPVGYRVRLISTSFQCA
jgi:hypothetical protein